MPSKNERRNESMAQQIVGVRIPLEGAVVVAVVVESSKSSAEPIAKPAVNRHGVEGEIKGSSKRGLVRDWNAIASLDVSVCRWLVGRPRAKCLVLGFAPPLSFHHSG